MTRRDVVSMVWILLDARGGQTAREIASAIGVSPSGVHNALRVLRRYGEVEGHADARGPEHAHVRHRLPVRWWLR